MNKIDEKITSIRAAVGASYTKPNPILVEEQVADLQKSEVALSYLRNERGLSDDTIKEFRLGYDSRRNAISIPIYRGSDLINIKYRHLNPDEHNGAKYAATRGAENWLFNDAALSLGKERGKILIVEGEFDCMVAVQRGFRNCISPALGAQSYGVWIELMDSIPQIYIAFDNDDAGKDASKKMATKIGTEKCSEVQYPDDIKDATEFFKKYTTDDFKRMISSAEPFYRYEFTNLSTLLDSMRVAEDGITSPLIPSVKMGKDWLTIISGPSNAGKCHARGTKILMHDGTVKMVENIIVGDKLMGADSKPRTVLSLTRGQDEMYEVKDRDDSYVVNSDHILCLTHRIRNKKNRVMKNHHREHSVKEWNSFTQEQRKRLRGYRVGVEFNNKDTTIPHYVLGLWLGDGTSSKPDLTTADKEIVDEIYAYAKTLSCSVREQKQKDNKSLVYSIYNKKGHKNPFIQHLKNAGIFNNKHIPHDYLCNSRKKRLELLAGLIDTDGSLSSSSYGTCYEITQKNKRLANDIVFLCRSLGFRTTMRRTIKTIKSIGFNGEYYRITIVGDLSIVPCRIQRKKSNVVSKKQWLTSNIEVKPIGIGEYYGFTLDGDGRYLLDTFIVTHNTSYTMNLAAEFVERKIPVLVLPFERGIESVGKRFLQVKYNMAEADFVSVPESDWKDMKDDCVDLQVYFARPHKEQLFDTIRRAKRIFDIQVVIIDHLDYMVRGSHDKNNEMAKTLQDFKEFAMDIGVILLVVHHVKKLGDTTSDPFAKRKPTLEDLKGSSNLYQDPECVIMLYSEEQNTLTVDVQKNKGKMFKKKFTFNVDTGRILFERDAIKTDIKLVPFKEQQKIAQEVFFNGDEQDRDKKG